MFQPKPTFPERPFSCWLLLQFIIFQEKLRTHTFETIDMELPVKGRESSRFMYSPHPASSPVSGATYLAHGFENSLAKSIMAQDEVSWGYLRHYPNMLGVWGTFHTSCNISISNHPIQCPKWHRCGWTGTTLHNDLTWAQSWKNCTEKNFS